MIANVNEQLWIDFDLDTAVFLDTIAYWIKKNALNKQTHNFQDGRYWTYNTLDAYTKMFPGWSIQNIRRIIRNCVNNNLLLVNNFNKKGFDRTGWFSLTDNAVQYYPHLTDIIHGEPDNPSPASCVGSNTAYVGSNTPIPKELTSISNIHNITNSESVDSAAPAIKVKKKTPSVEMRELINIYREEFPNNPQPHAHLISTTLEKTLRTFIKRWPEADSGKPLTLDGFRRYMQMLKSVSPKFSMGEYVTDSGNRKKNSLETFCRWNTFVKFLEESYT